MSVLKSLTFTAAPRPAAVSPEQQRRIKLAYHLREQLALAHADAKGESYTVKKRRWKQGADGEKIAVEVDKRLKRWWSTAADGSLVLVVRWGAKPLEFERGKAGIAVADPAKLIQVLEKLVAAAEAGEFDAMIAAANKQRTVGRKKAA